MSFSPEEKPDLEAELRAELRGLRTLLNWSLLGGLILSSVLAVYFLRELIVTRRQITEHLQYVGDFNRTMEDIESKFQAFARTNADFAPIVQRYFGTNSPRGTATPPSGVRK